jgi:hypothetical protein
MIKKIIEFIFLPIRKYKEKKEYERKVAEMKKRDPFIYK